jgi:RHS repeat-associated protein
MENGVIKHYFAETEHILANVFTGGHPLVPTDTILKPVNKINGGDTYEISKKFTIFAAEYFAKNANYDGCMENGIEYPADIRNLPPLHKIYDGAMGTGRRNKLYYFNANHLGSGSLITDGNGKTYQTLAYTPYGSQLVDIKHYSDIYNEPYRFTGYEKDGESGLNHANARCYDENTGFTSVDPLAEKFPYISGYNYVEWNPIMLIDPDGNEPVPAAPSYLIGTPAYYQWRFEDLVRRNGIKPQYHYYMNYGFKYAQRFQNETRGKLSPHGQKWVNEVMVNLQVAMENRLTDQIRADGTELELDAQKFVPFAFGSHKMAYWNEYGQAPLYTLNTVDLFAIVLTPDFNDLTSKEGMTQAGDIMGMLGKYWVNNPKVAAQRGFELLWNQDKIKQMILEKTGTEMGDRAALLYEQIQLFITNSNSTEK